MIWAGAAWTRAQVGAVSPCEAGAAWLPVQAGAAYP